jgi:hypothetical protein
MSRGKSTYAIETVLSSLLLSVPCPALADIAACTQAHASGQREAKAGRLKAASELFTSCGSGEDCPDAIRAECIELYRDVERSIPTVILTAVDERGKDITDVRVYSSDQLLTEELDGRSVPLDPGKHMFRFVPARGDVVSSEILVREGEKNRLVSVRVRTGSEPTPTSGHATEPEQAEGATTGTAARAAKPNSLPTGFWISAGTGAAALAGWGIFALLGHGHQSKLDECSPNCPASRHDDYDAMRRDYLIADVSLGVGVASAGVAAYYFFFHQPSSPDTNERNARGVASRVSVLPLLSTSGGGLVVNANAF